MYVLGIGTGIGYAQISFNATGVESFENTESDDPTQFLNAVERQ